MSWFSGKGRIDPSTGRNKRDKCTKRTTHGGPPRQIGTGKVVSRAEWRRQQKTRLGRTEQPSRHGERRGWVW